MRGSCSLLAELKGYLPTLLKTTDAAGLLLIVNLSKSQMETPDAYEWWNNYTTRSLTLYGGKRKQSKHSSVIFHLYFNLSEFYSPSLPSISSIICPRPDYPVRGRREEEKKQKSQCSSWSARLSQLDRGTEGTSWQSASAHFLITLERRGNVE